MEPPPFAPAEESVSGVVVDSFAAALPCTAIAQAIASAVMYFRFIRIVLFKLLENVTLIEDEQSLREPKQSEERGRRAGCVRREGGSRTAAMKSMQTVVTLS